MSAEIIARTLTCAAVIMLAACASYEPVQERGFAQLAGEGCRDRGQNMLVSAYVNKAYQNTVVLWDGTDPQQTMAVTLPRPGPLARVGSWFGKSKQQVTAETLNELATQRTPVVLGLECRGRNLAPQVQSIRYTDVQGQRVAIGY